MIAVHPTAVKSWIATALDPTADADTRRAAIALLVEMEGNGDPAIARALERIDSTDPLGLMLRYEARQAVWAGSGAEILPVTAKARNMARSFAAMNGPQIARDRNADAAMFAARLGLGVVAAIALVLIGSALWADTAARLDATLAQARCGDVCTMDMER